MTANSQINETAYIRNAKLILPIDKKVNMITELLEAAIHEVSKTRYEITEFQLGEEPYKILKEEVENLVPWIWVNIDKINTYKGCKVRRHPSKDAVMYAIQLKSKNTQ